MTLEEKQKAFDEMMAKHGSVGHVIACQNGSFTMNPDGAVDECFICDEKILLYKTSQAKKKEGWLLMCNDCWKELVRQETAKGKPVRLLGRIERNKEYRFPEPKP